MSRPRTPTNILELRGSFDQNPARGAAREGEPEAIEPLGDCPARLVDDQAKAWAELVEACHLGVLCRADRHHVELAARLLAESWTNPGISSAKIARLEAMLGKLGMNPSDRSRVKVTGQKKAGRLEGLRDAG